MRYGFVIDHNRCIGCHACTVACKEEHDVPVGVFRTWVKYIEKGHFPASRRHFGVMRCNHCDAAPCVEICPTSALFYRPDRIVDFDNSRCIGCQSCMQACPYDALYIHPDTHTAAKCNFCAHRIEIGLEPACVLVCPTRAISAGDLDDAESPVSRLLASEKAASRKPHKGTDPKLFYLGIDGAFLQPSLMEPQPSHLFAAHNPAANQYTIEPTASAEPLSSAQVVYDVAHRQAWDWMSALYLWTKSIAAGVLIIAILTLWSSGSEKNRTAPFFAIMSPAIAVLFTGLTAIFLIAHLKRPDRFYYILIKPNPRSWLVRGTWILMAYGAVAALWMALGVLRISSPPAIYALAIALALASAAYSAFLFGQAKGRDLWQSPLFIWILIAQTFVAGSAILLIVAPFFTTSTHAVALVESYFVLSLLINGSMILTQILMPPYSEDVRYAVNLVVSGSLRRRFWWGVITMGTLLPLALTVYSVVASAFAIEVLAALMALVGLFIFDDVWITAGQAPPLS